MNKMRKSIMAFFCASLIFISGCQSTDTTAPDLVESPYEVILTRPVKSSNIGQFVTIEADIRSERTYYYLENEFQGVEYKKKIGDIVKAGDVIAVTNQEENEKQIDGLEDSIADMKKNYETQKKSMELDIQLMELEISHNEKLIAELEEELANWVKDPESDRTKKDIRAEIKALKELNKELAGQIEDTKNSILYSKDSLNLSLIPIQRQLQQLKDKMAEGSVVSKEDGIIVMINDYPYNDSLIAITENQKDYYIAVSSSYAKSIYDYNYAVIGGKFYPLTRVYDDSNDANKVLEYGIAQPVMFEFADGMPADLDKSSSVLLCTAKEYKEDVLVVSNDSIYAMDSSPYVYVLENGVKVRRDITLGISTRTESEVVSGLSEGELVCYESNEMPPLEVKDTYTAQYETYITTSKFADGATKVNTAFFGINQGEKLISCPLVNGDTFQKGDTLYIYSKKVSQADILEAKNAIASAEKSFALQEKNYEEEKANLEKIIAESKDYEKNKAKLSLEKLNFEFEGAKESYKRQIEASKETLNTLLTEQNGIAVKAEYDGTVLDTSMTPDMFGMEYDEQSGMTLYINVAKKLDGSFGYYADNVPVRNFAKATIFFPNGTTASAKLLNCYKDGEATIEFEDGYGNSYGSWGMTYSNAPDVVADDPEVMVNYEAGTYVEFELSHMESVIIVPKSCIQKDDYGSFVWVQADNTYIKQYIQTGTMSTDTGTVVVSGLTPGDIVAILKN